MGRRKPARSSVERRRTSLPSGLPIPGRASPPAFTPGSRPREIKHCTYRLAHVRQDVYACRTCSKERAGASASGSGAVQLAGFCGACRATCHSRPTCDVIDLYSKRGFRCDCGNARMKNSCRLQPGKPPSSAGNERVYNHNFVGRYCRCDGGTEMDSEMMQCVVCEDWFHEKCLRMPNGLPADECDLSSVKFDFVCRECVQKHPFLIDYFVDRGLFRSEARPPLAVPAAGRIEACKRPGQVAGVAEVEKDTFFPQGFRSKLCRCRQCSAMYERYNCAFLVDLKDFISMEGVDPDDFKIVVSDQEKLAQGISSTFKSRLEGGTEEEPMFSDGEDVTEDEKTKKRRWESEIDGTASTLSDEHRRYIHARVGSFLSDFAMRKHGIAISGDDVGRMLAQIRSELVKKETA